MRLVPLQDSAIDVHRIETDPIPDQVQMLAQEVYAIDLLPLLANNMYRLDFEVGTPTRCFCCWTRISLPLDAFGNYSPLTINTL